MGEGCGSSGHLSAVWERVMVWRWWSKSVQGGGDGGSLVFADSGDVGFGKLEEGDDRERRKGRDGDDGVKVTAPNPEYADWFQEDKKLLPWLILSVTESIQPQVIPCAMAKETWQKLARVYVSGSRAPLHSLRHAPGALQKGNDSIEPVTLDDLHAYLLIEELNLKRLNALAPSPSLVPVVHYANGRGIRGNRGGGRYDGRGHNRSYWPNNQSGAQKRYDNGPNSRTRPRQHPGGPTPFPPPKDNLRYTDGRANVFNPHENPDQPAPGLSSFSGPILQPDGPEPPNAPILPAAPLRPAKFHSPNATTRETPTSGPTPTSSAQLSGPHQGPAPGPLIVYTRRPRGPITPTTDLPTPPAPNLPPSVPPVATLLPPLTTQPAVPVRTHPMKTRFQTATLPHALIAAVIEPPVPTCYSEVVPKPQFIPSHCTALLLLPLWPLTHSPLQSASLPFNSPSLPFSASIAPPSPSLNSQRLLLPRPPSPSQPCRSPPSSSAPFSDRLSSLCFGNGDGGWQFEWVIGGRGMIGLLGGWFMVVGRDGKGSGGLVVGGGCGGEWVIVDLTRLIELTAVDGCGEGQWLAVDDSSPILFSFSGLYSGLAGFSPLQLTFTSLLCQHRAPSPFLNSQPLLLPRPPSPSQSRRSPPSSSAPFSGRFSSLCFGNGDGGWQFERVIGGGGMIGFLGGWFVVVGRDGKGSGGLVVGGGCGEEWV
ncbi:hypothetical protein Droror1_Dr00023754 [Drosera rotundifolia]